MIELARRYGRYGYRRVAALLCDAGWQVNDKRVERLWRREGLKVPGKQPKRGRLWLNDGSCIQLRAERANHVWSYDFVHHRTHDGRAFRTLNVLDEFTRESLASRVRLGKTATSRASMHGCGTSSWTGRSSTPSGKPRSSSNPGGSITTPYARTAAWDTGYRLQKRSFCQAGLPAPLRSAGHPAWQRNRQCTNIRAGPVSGGRSMTPSWLRRAFSTFARASSFGCRENFLSSTPKQPAISSCQVFIGNPVVSRGKPQLWVCSFVGYASLVLKFLGTHRDKTLQLGHHLATGRAAGGLESRVQTLRQIQAESLGGLGLGRLCRYTSTRRVVAGTATLERSDLIVGRLFSRFGCDCEVLRCHS